MTDNHPHSYPPIDNDVSERPTSPRRSADHNPRVEPPAKMWPQYYATFSACTGGLIMGTTIGWSGPALNLLLNNNATSDSGAEFIVTENQGNFIASLMPAGALLGGLIGGALVGRLGRKGTMFWNSVLFALSYLLLAAAQNVWMLFAGRYLCGMASGITTIAAPTYVSETVSPHVRGMLGSCFQLLITIGVLYVGIVGAFTTVRWLSVACIALCLLWSILLLMVPESPSYSLSKKNYDAAREAMQFLRGHPYIETELSEIQQSMEEAASKSFKIADIIEPTNLKPLVIALMCMVGQQLSGVNAVIFFSVNIFEAAHTPLNSFVENIIIGATQVVATGIAALIVDKLGRRALLVTSALAMIVTLYGLGLYFWIQAHHPDVAKMIGFLPLSSLCLYIFAFSIGYGPIPWLIMSEIFAPEVKGFASSLTSSFNWTLAFFVTEFYGPVSKAVGPAATFWAFATILVLVMSFTIFFIPETKGRSLDEIQQLFKRTQGPEDEDPILASTDPVEASIEAEVEAEINVVRA